MELTKLLKLAGQSPESLGSASHCLPELGLQVHFTIPVLGFVCLFFNLGPRDRTKTLVRCTLLTDPFPLPVVGCLIVFIFLQLLNGLFCSGDGTFKNLYKVVGISILSTR